MFHCCCLKCEDITLNEPEGSGVIELICKGGVIGTIPTGYGSDGVIKMNFGQRGDVNGGLGPNPVQFSLAPGVEQQITLPTPIVFSSSTEWSDFVRAQDETEILNVDGTYGTRLIEQNIDKQINFWRFNMDYSRVDVSADEQLAIRLHNPISGFSETGHIQLLKEQALDEGVVILETIADGASIPEAGSGAGYQLFMKSTTNVDMSIRSITRTTDYKSKIVQF